MAMRAPASSSYGYSRAIPRHPAAGSGGYLLSPLVRSNTRSHELAPLLHTSLAAADKYPLPSITEEGEGHALPPS